MLCSIHLFTGVVSRSVVYSVSLGADIVADSSGNAKPTVAVLLYLMVLVVDILMIKKMMVVI